MSNTLIKRTASQRKIVSIKISSTFHSITAGRFVSSSFFLEGRRENVQIRISRVKVAKHAVARFSYRDDNEFFVCFSLQIKYLLIAVDVETRASLVGKV